MVLRGEAVSKVEGNIKARVDSGRSLVRTEVDIVKSSADELLRLKPVPAIVDLINKTGSNIGGFIKEQARITRGWVS